MDVNKHTPFGVFFFRKDWAKKKIYFADVVLGFHNFCLSFVSTFVSGLSSMTPTFFIIIQQSLRVVIFYRFYP